MRVIGSELGLYLKSAWRTFQGNKLRAILTGLGILIGVATVIAMVSIIEGINKAVYQSFASLGSKTLYITKATMFTGNRRKFFKSLRNPDFTLSDLEFIRQLPFIKVATGIKSSFLTIFNPLKPENSMSSNVIFTDHEALKVVNVEIAEGRWFTPIEVLTGRNVCVIGDGVRKLFDEQEKLIGKTLQAGSVKCRIIGVLKKRGGLRIFFGDDNSVFLPLNYAKEFKRRRFNVGLTIAVVIADNVSLEEGKELLRQALRRRRHLKFTDPDNFDISSMEFLLTIYRKLTAGIFFAMIFIASLSLLAAGVGIMNIMLVSVIERTREIGIRMAVGARRRDILLQFLIEATSISIAGGIIGIITGVGIAFIISKLTPLKATVNLWVVIIGFLFSVMVGIFFGIYPASKAAKLNPVEALRYE